MEMRQTTPSDGTFRSLKNFNYRVWASGALVSNIGTWMQRTAQDWLVLTQLTHHNASAVGLVMALQFAPQILMLPLSGLAADHFDRRKLLLTTQASMGILALGLGILTLTGMAKLWHVYIFAFVFGCVSAFDGPARQTFVSELVGETDLSNAVALNSTSFSLGRMVGPASAGLIIAATGTGWVFLINAASFAAVLISLSFLRVEDLHSRERSTKGLESFADGYHYVKERPDIKAIYLMLALIGTFGFNFPIFISTMAVTVYHAGSGLFGMLSSMMAIGSVSGALLAARREKPRITLLLLSTTVFGIGCTMAALMPNYWLFGMTLMLIGMAAQTFNNTANSTVQLSTEPKMRGRVLALLLAISLGGTPIGAPIVGWVADHYGARWALGVGAAAGFTAALVALYYLCKHRQFRFFFADSRIKISYDGKD